MEYQLQIKTTAGPLFLTASDKGLSGLYWEKQKKIVFLSEKNQNSLAGKILTKAQNQLSEYFSGQRKKFNIPLDLKGTPFQLKVWKELSKIPYGNTKSYKDIATQLKTKAYRAVGSANGKNPICILIPCHRVIASDGSIGGYSGGINFKKFLLQLEGIEL